MASHGTSERIRLPKVITGGRWRIHLLGDFSACNGDRSLRMPPTERRLLARLAVAEGNRVLSRAEVAAELWPEMAPEDARKRLTHALATLGKALRSGWPSPLTTTPATLALVREAIEIDVVDFMDLVRAGNGPAARQCYGGPLLPDDKAPWVVAQRARLQALFDGLSDAAVVTTTRLVRREVPVYQNDFVGRDADLARLHDAAASARMVTIVGPGGYGKTRLMIEASRKVDHHDLILFVPFERSTRGDSVLDVIRAVRGLRAQPRRLSQQLVADLQSYSSPLLLLDNLEQHAGTPRLALLTGLLDALPRLCVWASSRQPLGLPGEKVVRLRQLALPSVDSTLEQAARAPAIDLFCRRARASNKEFSLNANNLPAVLALCIRLDGWPLAIEMAASQIRKSSPSDLLLAIAARRPLSHSGRALGLAVPRQRSIERVIDWSWDLLPLRLQEALCAFAVFRGVCTAERAAQIAELKPRAARLALNQLCERSLMHPPERVDGHYRLDQTIAEYVRARTAIPLMRNLARRHREVFGAIVFEAAQACRAVAADDVADVIHALATTAAESPIDGAAFALALRTHWRSAGVTPQALSVLQQLARELPSHHPVTLALLCLVARLLFESGQGKLARTLTERALEQAGSDAARRAEALITWVNVRSRLEPDPQRLDAECREALALAREAGSALLIARALMQWGPVKIAVGDVSGARADFRTAARQFESAADEEGALGAIAGELGCDVAEGRYLEMDGPATRACERAEKLGNVELQLLMLNRLGCCADGLNQPERALPIYRRLAALARTAGLEYHFAIGIWNQCLPLAKQGKCEDAACLMAFSVRYWRSRFGHLSRSDIAAVAAVRRTVEEGSGKATWRRHYARGSNMSWAEGISFGLGVSRVE